MISTRPDADLHPLTEPRPLTEARPLTEPRPRPSRRTRLAALAVCCGLAAGLAPFAPAELLAAPPAAQRPSAADRPAGERLETLRGKIRRHPRAGTKAEMLTGRYHLYARGRAYEVIASPAVPESRLDAVAGKPVVVQVRRREIAEDRNVDVPVQRPSGGLPAKTVYDLVSLRLR